MTHRYPGEGWPRSSVRSGLFCCPGRLAAPRPHRSIERPHPAGQVTTRRAGLRLQVALVLALTVLAGTPAAAARLTGRVLDADSRDPVVGAVIDASHTLYRTSRTVSDTAGVYRLDLTPSDGWNLRVEALGYEPLQTAVALGEAGRSLDVALRIQPLEMDAMLVQARRPGSNSPVPAFVEKVSLEGAAHRQTGASLPQVLEQAAGVSIRRQGGLGSFSTISIRGSTAEQVQIYLDGVPLNQATGGGVDLGDLPVGGVESIEIYRGAVPARFGGNSIGGVVHIRTRQAGGDMAGRAHVGLGSFGTRRTGLSASGSPGSWRLLALVEYAGSDNDFRFWDDNGTEYNDRDDEWTERVNADFGSLRTLLKARRPWRGTTVQAHTSLDINRRGIPGIGNYQSLSTRFDTWRSTTEVEAFGTLGALGAAGYRLSAYRLIQSEEFSDLHDEVGAGTQHDRNRTHSLGARGEVNALVPRLGMVTVFAGWRRERFDPRNLLEPASLLLDSRRLGYRGGIEAELPLFGDRLQLSAGTQAEALEDRFWDQEIVAAQDTGRNNSETLWGHRLGLRLHLADAWTLQGHRGTYQRAPNFYELFGDRGAVAGNVDLTSESGVNWDAGLVYRPNSGTRLEQAEVAYYDNRTDDLIRFIQNSQRVSQPQNIGEVRIRGVEARVQVRAIRGVRLSGNYVYQRPENRSPFSYEKGNDLPNAPRHRLNLRTSAATGRVSLYHEISRESRHFLDRANLRPVESRVVQSLGGSVEVVAATELSWEIRNLTDNQVADLWGYPLPGRAAFVSLHYQFERTTDSLTR